MSTCITCDFLDMQEYKYINSTSCAATQYLILKIVTNPLCDPSRCSVVPDAHPDQKETQTLFQTSAG